MSDEYQNLTVAELKDILRERGLPVSGKKADLIARLSDGDSETPPTDDIEETPAVESADESDDTDDQDDEFDYDDIEDEWDDEEPDFHVAKQKPKLSDDLVAALNMRKSQAKSSPSFRRSEWFRYKRLSKSGWRSPKGMQNKQRMNLKYRSSKVRIGHGKVNAASGLHPSGFAEVMVYNTNDLESIDPDAEAARVGATVGGRKRALIHARADELGIRVLNRRRGI